MWATVLVAAEAWGSTPWEIAGGNPLVWLMRWQEFTSEMGKKAQGSGIYSEVDNG
jgi:hypothetical protein